MSKTVKSIIADDYKQRLGDHEDVAVISIRGVGAIDTTGIRSRLRGKKISVTVVRNSLAKRAFKDSALEALEPILVGPNALVYGGNSVVEVAREIVEIVKEFPAIELKGAVLDGELFEGEEGLRRLSKFPTREEAIARTVTLFLSPARNLMGQVKGPGARIAGVIKAIQERLEKGEAIQPA